jgi:hypothetical protein
MPGLRRIAHAEDFQKRSSGWRITRRGDPITSLFYLVTSFTKIVIVLGLLRQAMGLQQVSPNMVLNGLAMILTVYVIAPVGMVVGEAVQDKLKGGSNVVRTHGVARSPRRFPRGYRLSGRAAVPYPDGVMAVAAAVTGSRLGGVVLSIQATTASCMKSHRSRPCRRQVS